MLLRGVQGKPTCAVLSQSLGFMSLGSPRFRGDQLWGRGMMHDRTPCDVPRDGVRSGAGASENIPAGAEKPADPDKPVGTL